MTDLERRATRRHALRWVGGLGLAALASACSGRAGSSGQDETASVIQATTERTPAAAPEPYAGRGEPDVPNTRDGIYEESGGVTVVAVTLEARTSSD